MILLLGTNSYVGQAFARALRRRKGGFIPLSRSALDYTRFEYLFDYVRKIRPELVINAAERGGELDEWKNGAGEGNGAESRPEMLRINAVFPQTLARVCRLANIPWAHRSSGSIFVGGKVLDNGGMRLETDLGRPGLRELFAREPGSFRGFSEGDEPNCSFQSRPCTFYAGTKALAEEALRKEERGYVWRFHLPFNEQDEPGNFLSHLLEASKLHAGLYSLSHLEDCVGACLELWERRAPFGIYNIVNPGAVTTQEVVQMIHRIVKPARRFNLLVYGEQPAPVEPETLRSGCLLDPSKLRQRGVRLRTVSEAIEKSLRKWEGVGERLRAN
jgi:dTDP-4-dehydrorhamnose reductase